MMAEEIRKRGRKTQKRMCAAVSHIPTPPFLRALLHPLPWLSNTPSTSLPSSHQSLHPPSPLCLPSSPQLHNPSSSSQERWHTLRINLEMRCNPKAGAEERKVETTHMCLVTCSQTKVPTCCIECRKTNREFSAAIIGKKHCEHRGVVRRKDISTVDLSHRCSMGGSCGVNLNARANWTPQREGGSALSKETRRASDFGLIGRCAEREGKEEAKWLWGGERSSEVENSSFRTHLLANTLTDTHTQKHTLASMLRCSTPNNLFPPL